MTVEVNKLVKGNRIELINGDIAKVDHIFIKDEKGYILLDNYRWYVYFSDEDVEILD